MKFLLTLMTLIAATTRQVTLGFAPLPNAPLSSLALLSSSKDDTNNGNVDFALQELRIALTSMERQNLAPQQLREDYRKALEKYAETIVSGSSSKKLPNLQQALPGTKWKLVWSNEPAILEGLPATARVVLEFLDDNTTQMNYNLEFSTWGLSNLCAASRYSINDNTIVTITYEDVTANVLGMTNVNPGGMFSNLLGGRTTTIPTAFFNGELWIEQNTNGAMSIYVRQSDPNDNDSWAR